MEKKLNLHDLFGVLFPGAVVSAAVYFFLIRIGSVGAGQLDWGASLAMLPIAYVVGLLLHQVGSRFLHEDEAALVLMSDHDGTFTTQFKRQTKAAFEDLFKLPASGDRGVQQMMFNGCYDYVIQQGKGIYVENHYATYALCRSMVFVTIVVGTLALWLVARHPKPLPPSDYLLIAAIVGGTVVATWIFWLAKDKFIRTFARAVYRAFYSAYSDMKMPAHRPVSRDPIDE